MARVPRGRLLEPPAYWDGAVEIAFVDRPHLARTLRIWRYVDGGLTEVAAASGVSNHRLGAPVIEGGLRDCGQGPELVVVDSRWSQIVAVTLGEELSLTPIGPFEGRRSVDAKLICP